MNGSTAALLLITSANLAATIAIAIAANRGKRELEAQIDGLKKKTNKTVSRIKFALEDLEV